MIVLWVVLVVKSYVMLISYRIIGIGMYVKEELNVCMFFWYKVWFFWGVF